MKKKILLSALAISLVSSLNAADDLSSMFTEGKTSGQIRAFYIDREYQGGSGADTHRNSLALGGHLKFETSDYKGLSFGAAFYTSNDVPVLDYTKDDGADGKKDPTLVGQGYDSYAMLGEAYLQYTLSNTTFKGGRQTLDTPLAGSDDARMVKNLFEAYLLVNTDIPNTTLIAGHVDKFAQGTFGQVYNPAANAANSLLSVTSGYSAVDTKNQTGEFINMGKYSVGKSTNGVSVVSATYKKDGLKIQAWDYYAHDILNAIYADISYNMKMDAFAPYIAAQIISESDIGDKIAGDVNGLYWAAKAGAKFSGFNTYVAYSQTSSNDAGDAATKNAIITPWGGMPAYTQGMVTRHMFLAGTNAYKLVGSYSFKDMGTNLSMTAYYASFDMDANSGYGISRTATEPGFDIKYSPEAVKNLQLRFRGNFPRNFAEGSSGKDTGWNEYRLIANYNFSTK